MKQASYCEQVCRQMSAMGYGLRLDATADGYMWCWKSSDGRVKHGSATVHEKPVALFFACQDTPFGGIGYAP